MVETVKNEYAPRDVSPPGDTLADILEERGLSQAELSRRTGRPLKTISEIINGKAAIVPETAIQLERALGAPAEFWLAREARYREALARIADERRLKEDISWLKELPLKQMTDWGWVEKLSDKAQQVGECLKFFAVSSVAVWRVQYENISAAFRLSESIKARPGAVAAWLRKGEIEAAKINCAPWDAQKLEDTLPSIRALTMESNPGVFLPELSRILATSGVATAVVRQPTGCPASGATMFTGKNKDRATVLLSFRYLADDQFWFSVFHEIGHLLCHGKKGGTFMEGMGRNDKHEQEADDFAKKTLIPVDCESKLKGVTSAASIRAFAKEIGIAPGLVVGRLQHEEILRFNQCNDLKVRYQWMC